jgi:hypothetical protein
VVEDVVHGLQYVGKDAAAPWSKMISWRTRKGDGQLSVEAGSSGWRPEVPLAGRSGWRPEGPVSGRSERGRKFRGSGFRQEQKIADRKIGAEKLREKPRSDVEKKNWGWKEGRGSEIYVLHTKSMDQIQQNLIKLTDHKKFW